MSYYSVVKDDEVVGVLSKSNFVTFSNQGVLVPSKENRATAIVDDFGSKFRLPWMKQNEHNKDFEIVTLKEINNIQELIEISTKLLEKHENENLQ